MSIEYDRIYEELDISDESNPESLVNILPGFIANRMRSIPANMLELGEDELREACNATDTDILLRLSFWEEYRRVVRTKSKFNINNVHAGICSRPGFNKIVENTYKLAFMLTPPKEVQIALESLMYLSINEMEKWLKIPNFDKKGNANPRIGMVKLKIFEDIMNRRRGHVLRKTEVVGKHLNVNIDATVDNKEINVTIEDIDKRIRELEDLKAIEAPKREETIIPTKLRDVSEQEV